MDTRQTRSHECIESVKTRADKLGLPLIIGSSVPCLLAEQADCRKCLLFGNAGFEIQTVWSKLLCLFPNSLCRQPAVEQASRSHLLNDDS